MFTGIVRSLGTVQSIRTHDEPRVIVVDLGVLDADEIHAGDSIAVNGACLTVNELRDGRATFAVSPETVACCLIGEWKAGARVNLEPALTLQTPLGGHLMPGHIDGLGTVRARDCAGAFTRMTFETPRAIGRLVAAKGSIAVDGVSLTVNAVYDDGAQTRFEVMLVPHTLQATTLGALRPCARVHLEVDPLARYAQRLLESRGEE